MRYSFYAPSSSIEGGAIFSNREAGGAIMELIKITNKNGKQTVNARDLHNFLENKRQFSDWIKQRIERFQFEENHDFLTLSQNCENGGRQIEYFLSVEMAKELSMVENNDKGRQARRYFIECERRAKEVYKIPQTYSEALLLASKQAEKIEQQGKLLIEQKPKADFYDQIIDTNTKINMQEVAGVLNVKGYGRNNLFKFLREKEILNYKNIPYRKYIESGYFEVKERIRTIRGEDGVYLITLVTQKGIDYIRKKLEKELKQG